MKNQTNKELPIKQMILGVVVAFIVSLLCAGLTAYLVGKGTLSEDKMKIAMVFVSLFASFVGCLTALLSSKRNMLAVGCVVAIGYFLLLLCANLLFVDGRMNDVIWTILMIIGGSAAGILVSLRGFYTKSKRKLRIRK